MNRPDPPRSDGGEPLAESYLAEIGARLAGPTRAHVEIVAELRSGLLDAADAYRTEGLPPNQAMLAAISEFGEPHQVADGFRAELAAGQARRVSLGLLVSGPLVGLLWITAALASHPGIQLGVQFGMQFGLRFGPRVAMIEPWPDASSVLRSGVCLLAVVITAQIWAVLLGIAVTGRLTRRLSVRPRRAPAAAAIAGFGAASADAVILTLLAVQLATAPGGLSPLPVALASAASLTRLALASRAAHRCLAMRAVLI